MRKRMIFNEILDTDGKFSFNSSNLFQEQTLKRVKKQKLMRKDNFFFRWAWATPKVNEPSTTPPYFNGPVDELGDEWNPTGIPRMESPDKSSKHLKQLRLKTRK